MEELDALRKTFRAASQHYAKRIDMEIIRLRERIAGADLLLDIQNSPIALAVAKVATERRKLAITTGAAVPALTPVTR